MKVEHDSSVVSVCSLFCKAEILDKPPEDWWVRSANQQPVVWGSGANKARSGTFCGGNGSAEDAAQPAALELVARLSASSKPALESRFAPKLCQSKAPHTNL